MIKAYAGIGTRDITPAEREVIVRVAYRMERRGWVLYSGNAEGADQAFQEGSRGQCVVYLPWMGFELHTYDYSEKALAAVICGDTVEADELTGKYHPAPGRLSKGSRNLINRDAHQVIGHKMWPQARFVLCCANPIRGGGVQGGTGQAVRIAMHELNIPVINIRVAGWRDQLDQLLTSKQCLRTKET